MLERQPSDFTLFIEYGKKTREFLRKVFYLYRLPADKNVTVEYATPPRAFAKFLVPVLNGGNLNPTITFYLESAEFLEDQQHLGFVKDKKIIDSKARLVPAPLIYKLNYKVTISAATPTDCDKLTYQVLAYATKNRKMYDKVDGQWVEWYTHSLNDESTPEPGLEDKVVKKSVTVTIPRAYLPMDFDVVGLIGRIEMISDVEDSINEEI